MEKLDFVGQVAITKMELVSIVTGVSVDIRNLMVEMNIYEDIFSNYLSGTITISDSLDLINNIPLVGEENLVIEYHTPTIDSKLGHISNRFAVYKISDRALNADKSQMYILHFMSVEAFVDMHIKLGKSYKGNLSKIAARLFTDNDALGASDEIAKKSVFEETANAYQFVVPGWSPMKAINWIAARSVSRDFKTSNYLFYQDNFKYNFVSIDSLIVKPSTMKFVYTNINVKQLEKNQLPGFSAYNIVRHAINDVVFDISDRMLHGAYASKLVVYDILSKKVYNQELDYIKDFGKTKHLNKFPFNSSKITRNPLSHIIYYPTHQGMFDEFGIDDPEMWVLQRSSLMNQIESHKTEITVPGRSDYYVGMTIDYVFNTVQHHDKKNGDKDAVENYHSGKYLVSAINHRFSRNEHECILSLVKDSITSNLG